MKKQWWERFTVSETGCWEWSASCTKAGYGQVMVGGKQRYSHRLFYERFKGPIPEGLQLDHLCRNKRCCNPSHLEVVTGRVNVRRSTAPPAANAVATHCLNGHAFTEANTFTYSGKYGPKRQCRECKRLRQLQYTRRKKQRAPPP